jgi:hypothetical protein
VRVRLDAIERGSSVKDGHGQRFALDKPDPLDSRCPSCAVGALQEHLDDCSLGQGLYRPERGDPMHPEYSPDQTELIKKIKRNEMLPESKRKHRRIHRLLSELKPENYKYLKDD